METAAQSSPRIAIIGGGAAGFFTAITVAEANPSAQVVIYEKSQNLLSKVRISGGGRCNVTHHCFDPKELSTRYPRGARELRAAFHRWQPQDTIQWFAERGVELKVESDGRMFPITDDSQTIIDCFLQAARQAGVQIRTGLGLKTFTQDDSGFLLHLSDDSQIRVDKLCLTTGSLKASPLTRAIETIGHSIEPLAPSLFAFNVADKRTHALAGLSVQNATVTHVGAPEAKTTPPQKKAACPGESKSLLRASQSKAQSRGPILITHRGFSGPAILKLSAWEARALQSENYHFEISINWLGDVSENQLHEQFNRLRKSKGKTLVKTKLFEAIPRRLWERLVEAAQIFETDTWAQLSKEKTNALIQELVDARFQVQGKTTNKDEFVTCGGVCLKEVDFRRMESKLAPNLHFAGECLDIDGITGGFNFQAAWTGGRIAGEAMAEIS